MGLNWKQIGEKIEEEKKVLIIIENKVYDVTSFKEHPGHFTTLVENQGRDSTNKFKQIHSNKAFELKKQFYIDDLDNSQFVAENIIPESLVPKYYFALPIAIFILYILISIHNSRNQFKENQIYLYKSLFNQRKQLSFNIYQIFLRSLNSNLKIIVINFQKFKYQFLLYFKQKKYKNYKKELIIIMTSNTSTQIIDSFFDLFLHKLSPISVSDDNNQSFSNQQLLLSLNVFGKVKTSNSFQYDSISTEINQTLVFSYLQTNINAQDLILSINLYLFSATKPNKNIIAEGYINISQYAYLDYKQMDKIWLPLVDKLNPNNIFTYLCISGIFLKQNYISETPFHFNINYGEDMIDFKSLPVQITPKIFDLTIKIFKAEYIWEELKQFSIRINFAGKNLNSSKILNTKEINEYFQMSVFDPEVCRFVNFYLIDNNEEICSTQQLSLDILVTKSKTKYLSLNFYNKERSQLLTKIFLSYEKRIKKPNEQPTFERSAFQIDPEIMESLDFTNVKFVFILQPLSIGGIAEKFEGETCEIELFWGSNKVSKEIKIEGQNLILNEKLIVSETFLFTQQCFDLLPDTFLKIKFKGNLVYYQNFEISKTQIHSESFYFEQKSCFLKSDENKENQPFLIYNSCVGEENENILKIQNKVQKYQEENISIFFAAIVYAVKRDSNLAPDYKSNLSIMHYKTIKKLEFKPGNGFVWLNQRTIICSSFPKGEHVPIQFQISSKDPKDKKYNCSGFHINIAEKNFDHPFWKSTEDEQFSILFEIKYFVNENSLKNYLRTRSILYSEPNLEINEVREDKIHFRPYKSTLTNFKLRIDFKSIKNISSRLNKLKLHNPCLSIDLGIFDYTKEAILDKQTSNLIEQEQINHLRFSSIDFFQKQNLTKAIQQNVQEGDDGLNEIPERRVFPIHNSLNNFIHEDQYLFNSSFKTEANIPTDFRLFPEIRISMLEVGGFEKGKEQTRLLVNDHDLVLSIGKVNMFDFVTRQKILLHKKIKNLKSFSKTCPGKISSEVQNILNEKLTEIEADLDFEQNNSIGQYNPEYLSLYQIGQMALLTKFKSLKNSEITQIRKSEQSEFTKIKSNMVDRISKLANVGKLNLSKIAERGSSMWIKRESVEEININDRNRPRHTIKFVVPEKSVMDSQLFVLKPKFMFVGNKEIELELPSSNQYMKIVSSSPSETHYRYFIPTHLEYSSLIDADENWMKIEMRDYADKKISDLILNVEVYDQKDLTFFEALKSNEIDIEFLNLKQEDIFIHAQPLKQIKFRLYLLDCFFNNENEQNQYFTLNVSLDDNIIENTDKLFLQGGAEPCLRIQKLVENCFRIGLEGQLKITLRSTNDEIMAQTSIQLTERYLNKKWHHLIQKPIETRSIKAINSDFTFARMRLWIDIFDSTEEIKYPSTKIGMDSPLDFELRLNIHKIEQLKQRRSSNIKKGILKVYVSAELSRSEIKIIQDFPRIQQTETYYFTIEEDTIDLKKQLNWRLQAFQKTKGSVNMKFKVWISESESETYDLISEANLDIQKLLDQGIERNFNLSQSELQNEIVSLPTSIVESKNWKETESVLKLSLSFLTLEQANENPMKEENKSKMSYIEKGNISDKAIQMLITKLPRDLKNSILCWLVLFLVGFVLIFILTFVVVTAVGRRL